MIELALGILIGLALSSLAGRGLATPRVRGHHPRQPTSKPKGPPPIPPPVGRFGLPEIRVDVQMPKCKPPRGYTP